MTIRPSMIVLVTVVITLLALGAWVWARSGDDDLRRRLVAATEGLEELHTEEIGRAHV